MKILFTGDFAPILDVEERLLSGNPEIVFEKLLSLLKEHDEVVVNLECPLTESNKKRKKTGPNLRANPLIARSLKNSGISIASLANNHIMDYGHSGLTDTIRCLSDNGVATFGAGENSIEASNPHIVRNDRDSIALLAYAEHEYSISGPNDPGANPINPLRNAVEIKRLLSEHDYVIVTVHGGHEYQRLPSPYYVDLMRYYASLGVHAVIGHHTHCIGLMERYNGVPIYYGLGNFIFPWMESKSKAWYEGLLLSMEFLNGRVSTRILPVEQDKNGVASYCQGSIRDSENCSYFKEQEYFVSDEYLRQINDYLRCKGEATFLNLSISNRVLRYLVKRRYLPVHTVLGDRIMSFYHSLHCEGSLEAIRAYLESNKIV